MIASDPGAERVGEFSLTDGRLSRITRFMAETLFDENRGGPEGNFHIALGSAYKDAYTGDPATLQQARLEEARLQRVVGAHGHRLDRAPRGHGVPARRKDEADLPRRTIHRLSRPRAVAPRSTRGGPLLTSFSFASAILCK